MSVLQDMIDDAPDQITSLENSIGQIEDQMTDLLIEINAIKNDLCTVAKNELIAYLDGTKLTEIENLYGSPEDLPFTVEYYGDFGTYGYGTGNITDFRIIDNSGNIEYEIGGIHWDSDSLIIKLTDDYAFGNDYLTRPLDTGATYGLEPTWSALDTARSILLANKYKIENSITIFEDYA